MSVPAALLALLLSTAPALAILCGVDCGQIGAHATSHDCHDPAGLDDATVIGPGPEACTHLRFDTAPAKPSAPTHEGPSLRLLAAQAPPPAGTHSVVGLPGASFGRLGAPAVHPAGTPALVLPLRI